MKLIAVLALILGAAPGTRAQTTSHSPRRATNLLALQQATGGNAASHRPTYFLTGQVLGPDGRPLPGATLFVKGTRTMVSTDAAGEYKLTVPAQTPTVLVAAYAGCEDQTLTAAPNQPVLNLSLRPALTAGLSHSLRVGDFAPDFELPTTTGTDFKLSEHRGHPVVLYFYPKDGSSGCTKEACSFRDQYQDFRDLGAEVIGISSDDAASHQQFTAKYALPFPLLADQGGQLRKKYAVPRAAFGLLPGRVTYVLDREGRVRYVFNSLNGATDHVLNAKQILQGLN